jgi:pimeloyl-ACP methyl ester carboxylesterase
MNPRLLIGAAILCPATGCSGLVATAVARAPNHGLSLDPAEDPDFPELIRRGVNAQLRIEVGPPAASLSVWVVDPLLRTGVDFVPRGTIILLHGWHREKAGLLRFARPLARAGYRAVLVDHRGQGGSSGDWLTYGVVEARDLSQVLDGLQARGLLAGQVGVLGYSYGAAVAIQFAAGDERVKAVAALAPFSSLRELVPRYVRWLPFWGWFAPESAIQDAISEAGRRAGFDPSAASPLAAMGRLRAPVLLIHGGGDWLIPAAHSRRLRAAAAGPSQLVLIEGVGHNALCRDPGGMPSAASIEWFERWLAGSEARCPLLVRG